MSYRPNREKSSDESNTVHRYHADSNTGKGKGRVLATALLTWVRLATRSTLQSRKWQLIGMS